MSHYDLNCFITHKLGQELGRDPPLDKPHRGAKRGMELLDPVNVTSKRVRKIIIYHKKWTL